MSGAKKYYEDKRTEVSVLLPKQYTKVLEIGCGGGEFRGNLKLEHEYWGVELVASIAELEKNKIDKVLIGTYQQVVNQIPNDYFDLVICNDVIEHMPNHDEFFQSIKGKMKKDGCLVASIPNVRYFWNVVELLVKKDWRYKERGILDTTHLRFFTKKSLIRTLNNHSFSIEIISGLNSYAPESIFKKMIYSIVIFIFGRDIKYLQYGVRIKTISSSID
jgi:2-polyprenyl-3-methyl-5-hydroxy-6-metoxy-1,4-benzoquinol methylase